LVNNCITSYTRCAEDDATQIDLGTDNVRGQMMSPMFYYLQTFSDEDNPNSVQNVVFGRILLN
jgi:hypothetical protein